jgi:hypothetical protein
MDRPRRHPTPPPPPHLRQVPILVWGAFVGVLPVFPIIGVFVGSVDDAVTVWGVPFWSFLMAVGSAASISGLFYFATGWRPHGWRGHGMLWFPVEGARPERSTDYLHRLQRMQWVALPLMECSAAFALGQLLFGAPAWVPFPAAVVSAVCFGLQFTTLLAGLKAYDAMDDHERRE